MEEWTSAELGAAVEGYFELLADEVAGRVGSKTAVRDRLLAGPLASRTRGSVEYRMQNISAVLDGMGKPWLTGYKPAGNVGPTNTLRLREIIAGFEHSHNRTRAASPNSHAISTRVEPRRVYVANFGRENFEWPRCLAGHYVATMQDERAHRFWANGDRSGYVDFGMATLKTAKGLPPTRPVAGRWYNLGTIVVESSNDLWLHRQGACCGGLLPRTSRFELIANGILALVWVSRKRAYSIASQRCPGRVPRGWADAWSGARFTLNRMTSS